MVRKPVPQQAPVTWSQSTGMVGAYLLQLLGVLAAVPGALLAVEELYPGSIPRWVILTALVITLAAGGGGLVKGRMLAAARRAKGESDEHPEPAIRRVVRDGGFSRTALLAVLGGGGLLLLLIQCSGPVLTERQADSGERVIYLTCDIARELVQPEVLPVDQEAEELADRICDGVELAAGFIMPLLAQPPDGLTFAPRLAPGGPPAPRVSCAAIGSRCVLPELSEEARQVCDVLVAACQAGDPVEARAVP